jgi:hypothetical protein
MALTIPLEGCRELFASDAAMAKFADLLRQSAEEVDTPVLTFQDQPVVTTLSLATTQSVLRDRILRKLAEQPNLLERFVDRLSNLQDGDIVD